jgi:hypothetical protein
MRDVVLAAVPAAEQCDMRAGLDVERHAVDAIGAAVFGVHECGRRDLSFEPRHFRGRLDHELRIDETRRLELGDDLLVLDADVLLRRIPGQDFLPRRQDVLVGRQHGHERAERQAALEHQEAAHRVEKERRDLCQEVVQELDEELALEDVEADRVDPAEPVADVGALAQERVVGADLGGAGDRLADAVRTARGLLHPLLRQLVDLLLQLRMSHTCGGYNATAARPSQKSCTKMNTMYVSRSPPWNAGRLIDSPMKPPIGSVSATTIGMISPEDIVLNCGRGKRSTC